MVAEHRALNDNTYEFDSDRDLPAVGIAKNGDVVLRLNALTFIAELS